MNVDEEVTVHILLQDIPLAGNVHDKTIQVKVDTTVGELLAQAVEIFKKLGMKEPEDSERYCVKQDYQVVVETKKVQELIDNRTLNKAREPVVSVHLSTTPKTVTTGVTAFEKQTEFDVKVLHRR